MTSFTYDKEGKEKKLTQSLAEQLAKELSVKYEALDKQRNRNIQDGELILNKINRDAIEEINFDDTVQTDSIYELYESLKANIRKAIDDNSESFAVCGRDEQAQKQAEAQKEYLIFKLRDMQFKNEAKKIAENYLIYGEFLTFCEWQIKAKQVRRRGAEGFEIKEVIDYEGSKVEAVRSIDFVFDVWANNFDKAIKIRRKLTTYEEITEEKTFDIDKETRQELKEQCNSKGGEYDKDDKEQGKIELLECWGDVKLSDGTLLKNKVVVVANGKYVIRFEDNPYLNNPWSLRMVGEDHKTKRGVSPLKVALSGDVLSSAILTNMLKILELIQNPPLIGPEGLLDESENMEWQPGKYYPVDDWQAAQMPSPVQFNSTAIDFKYLDYFKSLQQANTGIFPYMAGIQDNSSRTATESSILMNGQQVRLMMVIDELQDFLLEIVEKVAELQANFSINDEMVSVEKNETAQNITINNDIRQASYKYDYKDRRSELQKQQDVDKFVMGLKTFMESGAPVNTEEAFKYWLSYQNIKQPETFIQSDKLSQIINNMPEEERQQARDMAAQGLIKQLQEMQLARQQQQIPAGAQAPPIMQA